MCEQYNVESGYASGSKVELGSNFCEAELAKVLQKSTNHKTSLHEERATHRLLFAELRRHHDLGRSDPYEIGMHRFIQVSVDPPHIITSYAYTQSHQRDI